MAMPSAKGLFHRAIMQSGPMLKGRTTDMATEYAEKFLHNIGLKSNQINKLHDLPVAQMIAAAEEAFGTNPYMIFRPVADGRALPSHPFSSVATELSADVPLMIGTTEYETTTMSHVLDFPVEYAETGIFPENMLHKYLYTAFEGEFVGGSEPADMSYVKELVKTHRQNYPGASAYDTFFWITSNKCYRIDSQIIADRKSRLNEAPVYMYLFAWDTPFLGGGIIRSTHSSELPFIFNALDAVGPLITGRDPRAYSLAENMSSAWANFARTGNPNHAGLPSWPTYDMQTRQTMIFDNQSKVESDPDGEELRAMK